MPTIRAVRSMIGDACVDRVGAPPTHAPPTARPVYAATGLRLGAAVLGFVAAVVLIVTLEPFAFRWPTHVRVSLWEPDSPWFGTFDVVANVGLFLPLGFLFALTRAAVTARAGQRTLAHALGGGALLSAAIEIAQCFEPQRYPSPTDVCANALGALFGAWLHRRLARRLGVDTPIVDRLALQLPVMGLVYLTLPLVTLAALTTASGGARTALPRALGLAALALVGGTLLGCVQRRHLAHTGATTPAMMAAAAALWFGTGALPVLATAPGVFATGLGLAALAAWLLGRHPVASDETERRFEHEAIARATPFLALYLVLLPLGNVAAGAAPTLERAAILRHLEDGCAFIVLGYLLAETWGRRELHRRHAAARVMIAAAGVAIALATLARLAAPPAPLAAVVGGVAVRALAAGYGAWLYHLQRAHVRALVAARRAPVALVPAVPTMSIRQAQAG